MCADSPSNSSRRTVSTTAIRTGPMRSRPVPAVGHCFFGWSDVSSISACAISSFEPAPAPICRLDAGAPAGSIPIFCLSASSAESALADARTLLEHLEVARELVAAELLVDLDALSMRRSLSSISLSIRENASNADFSDIDDIVS